jgi:L-ascorbate metabolism protein UlaG (beta-lactamase superfamily)
MLKLRSLLLVLSGVTAAVRAHPLTMVKSCVHEHAMQPLVKNNRYFNHHDESRFSHVLDALRIFWATKTSFKKYYNADPLPWVKQDSVWPNSVPMQIQWIGHASFLIQVKGFNVLTDPIFYDLHKILYPRKTPVGINPEKLPKIDFVVISHNHRDHLDEASMQLLKQQQPIMLVPQGNKQWFVDRGFEQVMEHVWWQETHFERDGATIEFTFVPAVHWSNRHAFDAHNTLWGGWVIKGYNKTIYFAGDTGYSEPMFKAIADYAKTIHCALLPIGPCEPRAMMCHSHMGPEDAVEVYKLLQPQLVVPMHWGTFGLGPDSFGDPMQRLTAAWTNKIPAEEQDKLYKIKFGERIVI